jgi:hypothetical protein
MPAVDDHTSEALPPTVLYVVEEDWSALEDLGAPLGGLLAWRQRLEATGARPDEVNATIESLAVARGMAVTVPTRICDHCRQPYGNNNGQARYCSHSCAYDAGKARAAPEREPAAA